MKRQLLIVFLCLLTISLFSQAPKSFRYQTVIRSNNGTPKVNTVVSLQISILQGSEVGTVVYSETHNKATNEFGIVNLNIGEGSILSGEFANIDWSQSPFFLKIDLDITGGSNYLFMGTSQLLSVPFALYAENTLEKQTLTRNGNKISLNPSAGTVSIDDNDNDSTNEIQTLKITKDILEISKGNSVHIDKDTTNEIQVLTKNGNTITLSKSGGTVTDSDNQTLQLNGNSLQITGGNSIILSGTIDIDADPTNEIQNLLKNGDTLQLSKSNKIILDHNNDNDSLNEIQTIKIQDDTLILSKANSVSLTKYLDNTDNQTLSKLGNSLSISNGNTISIDADTTNEIQTLTYTNDTLIISKANKVFMPEPFSFNYPDGFQSVEPVTFIANSSSVFIHKKIGYNLYITNINSNSVGGMTINSKYANYCFPDVRINANPFIIAYNDTIGDYNGASVICNGFYVKAKVEPFCISIGNNNYVMTKDAIILNIYSRDFFLINGNKIVYNSNYYYAPTGEHYTTYQPIFIKKGDILQAYGTNSATINGYYLK